MRTIRWAASSRARRREALRAGRLEGFVDGARALLPARRRLWVLLVVRFFAMILDLLCPAVPP